MQKDNDGFRLKVGKPKRPSNHFRKLTSQAAAAGVNLKSLRAPRVPKQKSRHTSSLFRGSAAARISVRPLTRTSRRVVVKTRIVNLKRTGRRSIPMHLKYIERDGVSSDGSPARAYNAETDVADTEKFTSRSLDDRHQFRFIVSPEDGVELSDLRVFTRDLMDQVQRDLGTRLEWVAVDHWDTDNPHTHIVLRGKDSENDDLVIASEYLTSGMRGRASELAESWLGPRTELEIERSLRLEVDQERWTSVDRTLQPRSVDGEIDLRQRDAGFPAMVERNVQLGRLMHLRKMGLAEELSTSVWSLNPEAESVLRALGERGDVIRTMQRAFSNARDYDIVGAEGPPKPIVGRIAGKGLADELADRRYLIVDGIDGRAHYIVLPTQSNTLELPIGGIVQIRSNDRVRVADHAITKLAHDGVYRTERHFEELARSNHSSDRNPEDLVLAHERRLEALRRAGIVERLDAGVWRVPADLPQRGLDYDVKRAGRVDVNVLSTLPIEAQVRAFGATWLDRQLLGDPTDVPKQAFGAETKQAMRQRINYLIEEGFAERQGNQVMLRANLLATLRDREIAATAKSIATQTGLTYSETLDGEYVGGIYRKSLMLASGRFAMLEDGAGFSLVPWRPMMEEHLGGQLRGVVNGMNISWDFSRSRGLGR